MSIAKGVALGTTISTAFGAAALELQNYLPEPHHPLTIAGTAIMLSGMIIGLGSASSIGITNKSENRIKLAEGLTYTACAALVTGFGATISGAVIENQEAYVQNDNRSASEVQITKNENNQTVIVYTPAPKIPSNG